MNIVLASIIMRLERIVALRRVTAKPPHARLRRRTRWTLTTEGPPSLTDCQSSGTELTIPGVLDGDDPSAHVANLLMRWRPVARLLAEQRSRRRCGAGRSSTVNMTISNNDRQGIYAHNVGTVNLISRQFLAGAFVNTPIDISSNYDEGI